MLLHLIAVSAVVLSSPPRTPEPLLPARAETVVAASDDLDLGEYERRLVSDMEQLIESCQAAKAYGLRDRIYASLLHFAPDHTEARRVLSYKRDRSGEWVQGGYRTPKNYKPDAVPGLERDLETSCTALARVLSDSLEAARAPRTRRRTEFEKLLRFAPESVAIHAELDQERHEGRWVQSESARGLRARAKLRALANDYQINGRGGQPWTFAPDISSTGVSFSKQLETDRVRVAVTGEPEEAERATKVLHHLQDFLREIFPVEMNPMKEHRGRMIPDDENRPEIGMFTFVLVDSEKDRDTLISQYPGLTTAERELLPQMASAWLDQGGTLGIWVDTASERIDAAVRQRIGAFFRDHFQVSTKQGWIWEGFGMLLTERILGTRKTFFVRPTKYVDGGPKLNLNSRMRGSTSDWFALALERLEADPPPRIPFMLGRDVNQMNSEDLLLSYALAGYLIEAHPKKAMMILERTGRGEDSIKVLEGAFLRPLAETMANVERWLREVTPESGALPKEE